MKRDKALFDFDHETVRTKGDKFFYRTSVHPVDSIRTADAILANEPIALMNWMEKTTFMGFDHEYPTRSHALYYNSLRLISFLLDAYHLSKDKKYYGKALEFYKEWRRLETDGALTNVFVWNDATVSNRVLTLTYLVRSGNHAIAQEDFEDLVACLEQHGEWLLDDNNYSDNNHGVMQDRALCQLGVFLSRTDFVDKARNRIRAAFRRDFSPNGVHSENSIAYHIMMLKMYKELFAFMGESAEKALIAGAETYKGLLLKPDGSYPMEGDSAHIQCSRTIKLYSNFCDFVSGKVIVNLTNAAGTSLPDTSAADCPYKTGGQDSVYIFFKSGYTSITHKHLDDLSFVLSVNGEDIFVDAGKYSYDLNKYRWYFRAPCAHNTIFIHKEIYILERERYDPALFFFHENDAYIHAQGQCIVNNQLLIRDLIYIDGSVILLDRALLRRRKKLRQNFNIMDKHAVVIDKSRNAIIRAGSNDIVLRQHLPVCSVNEFREDHDHIRGFCSLAFNRLSPLRQLEYSTSASRRPRFITTIDFCNLADMVSDVSYDARGNILAFLKGGATYRVRCPDWAAS